MLTVFWKEKNMIEIVCLKWGNKYSAEYVNKLYASVERNSTVPFRFHCFTDDETEVRSEVIVHNLPYTNLQTWWNKLYLFSELDAFPIGSQIFYVDLDTVIVDNIDMLLLYKPKKLTVLKDFLHGLAKTAGTMGSGLMLWTHGDYTHVWTKFIKNPEAAIKQVEPHGDQHWIDLCVSDRDYWQDLFPSKVVSFKVHCLQGLPTGAAVICYHGKPSIPESATMTEKIWKFNITPQPWVLEHWKE